MIQFFLSNTTARTCVLVFLNKVMEKSRKLSTLDAKETALRGSDYGVWT